MSLADEESAAVEVYAKVEHNRRLTVQLASSIGVVNHVMSQLRDGRDTDFWLGLPEDNPMHKTKTLASSTTSQGSDRLAVTETKIAKVVPVPISSAAPDRSGSKVASELAWSRPATSELGREAAGLPSQIVKRPSSQQSSRPPTSEWSQASRDVSGEESDQDTYLQRIALKDFRKGHAVEMHRQWGERGQQAHALRQYMSNLREPRAQELSRLGATADCQLRRCRRVAGSLARASLLQLLQFEGWAASACSRMAAAAQALQGAEVLELQDGPLFASDLMTNDVEVAAVQGQGFAADAWSGSPLEETLSAEASIVFGSDMASMPDVDLVGLAMSPSLRALMRDPSVAADQTEKDVVENTESVEQLLEEFIGRMVAQADAAELGVGAGATARDLQPVRPVDELLQAALAQLSPPAAAAPAAPSLDTSAGSVGDPRALWCLGASLLALRELAQELDT